MTRHSRVALEGRRVLLDVTQPLEQTFNGWSSSEAGRAEYDSSSIMFGAPDTEAAQNLEDPF